MPIHRSKKVNIYELSKKENFRSVRKPYPVQHDQATASMGDDEEFPLFSEDEKFKGDFIDGVYHCFEKTEGVYLSHFSCDTYRQLKNHMFFLHT